MRRRRPTSWPGEPHRGGVPRGLPGIGIVPSVGRSRKGIAGTMPYPARPGECQKPACSEVMRDRGEGPPSSSSATGATRECTLPSWSSAVRWGRPEGVDPVDEFGRVCCRCAVPLAMPLHRRRTIANRDAENADEHGFHRRHRMRGWAKGGRGAVRLRGGVPGRPGPPSPGLPRGSPIVSQKNATGFPVAFRLVAGCRLSGG